MEWAGSTKAFCVLEFAKAESVVTVERRFRTVCRAEPPADGAVREWYMKFKQNGCLYAAKRTSNSPGISCNTHELFCPRVVLCGARSEASVPPSQLTQFWRVPGHRTLSYSLFAPCFVTTAPYRWGLQVRHDTWYTDKFGEILYFLICSFLLCLS